MFFNRKVPDGFLKGFVGFLGDIIQEYVYRREKHVQLSYNLTPFLQISASPQPAATSMMTIEEKVDADSRSIYVGNVS